MVANSLDEVNLERDSHIHVGQCKPGICGFEAGCKNLDRVKYTCICPHGLSPSLKDGKCPTTLVIDPIFPKFTQPLEAPSEKIHYPLQGQCKPEICGKEASCENLEGNKYTCLCPQDSSYPSKDLKCPPVELERQEYIRNGQCKPEICGIEAGCKKLDDNRYKCMCPHDSAPPTKDLKCPTRIIVPIDPKPIQNIRPPGDDVKLSNKTNVAVFNSTKIPPLADKSETHLITSSLTSTNTIIIASTVSILLLIFFIILWKKRKGCSVVDKNSSSPSPVPLKRNILVPERYAPNPQYSVCPASAVPVLRKETLKFLNAIGEGYFGKVFKGELEQENSDTIQIVAIKVLKESANREAEEDFLREVDIMSSFKHPNILSLLGVVLREVNVGPMMVFEYMPHGDLAEVLRNQKKQIISENEFPTLTSRDLLSVSLQIASGMKYLAAQRFVHRDLACRNCLVASGPIVKISDFGMSRDVYTCDYYKVGTKHALPVRWMSPECLMYGRFTLDSDIWSYGIVLWEIYSFGKQPYFGHTNDEVIKLIYEGIILIPPEDCPPLICDLMRSCWKTEPRDRIKFCEIYERLEKVFENFEESEEKKPVHHHRHHNQTFALPQLKVENEWRQNSSTLKRLPRPPPILPQIELLDTEGYLLPNKVIEPAQYVEALDE